MAKELSKTTSENIKIVIEGPFNEDKVANAFFAVARKIKLEKEDKMLRGASKHTEKFHREELKKIRDARKEEVHIYRDENNELHARLKSGKEIEVRQILDSSVIKGSFINIEKDRDKCTSHSKCDFERDKKDGQITLKIKADDLRRPPITLSRELTRMTYDIYDRAGKMADKYREDFIHYSDHRDIHIQSVAATAVDVAYSFGIRDDQGLREVFAAAVAHDYGMAALSERKGKELIPKETGEDIRKTHALNSALEVLLHADLYRKDGINPQNVALEVIIHSKSSSGVDSLASPYDMLSSIDKMEKAAQKYDILTPSLKNELNQMKDKFNVNPEKTQIKYGFDKEKEKDTEKEIPTVSIKDEYIKEIYKLQTIASAVIIGDAFSHASGTGENVQNQAGNSIEILRDGKEIEKETPITNYVLEDGKINEDAINDELKGVELIYKDDGKMLEETTLTKDAEDIRCAYPLGEPNLSYSISPNKDSQTIDIKIEIQNINFFPHSTALMMKERIEELPRLHFHDAHGSEIPITVKVDFKDEDKYSKEEIKAANKFFENYLMQTFKSRKFDDASHVLCNRLENK